MIERGGEPVCRLVPAIPVCKGSTLQTLLSQISKPDPEFWNAVEEAVRRQPELPGTTWSS